MLLSTEFKFADRNLANGDLVTLFDCDGYHILKVMWEVSVTEAVNMTLGDEDDDNGWSNETNITGSTSVKVVGISTSGYGDGKSFIPGTEKLLQLKAGGTLETGSITVKILAVKM
jgi:hypothetical protein